MFDLFSFIVYITLLLTLISLTVRWLAESTLHIDFATKTRLDLYKWVGLLLISFIVGFRYNVGVDWLAYKETFEFIKHNPSLQHHEHYMEFGYFYLNRITSKLGLSYEWMFFSIALISWYLIFKSVPQMLIAPFVYFLFVDEFFFWSMNGVRQFTAIGFWLLAIREIFKKNFVRYLFFILSGSLFHASILLLLPFYFIPYHKLYNKWIWLLLLLISLIIGSSSSFIRMVESAMFYLGEIIPIVGLYIRYIESGKFMIDEETQTGLGFLFRIVLNILIILLSGNVIRKYPVAKVYFFLFFLGSVLFNLSYNIQLLTRITNFFIIIRSLVLAISIYYYWQIPKYRIFIVGFFIVYFLLFITTIYNSSNMCSPYRFTFWIF